MMEAKLTQMRYEKETWKRLVSFMTEENILLKNRLSEVLKDSFSYNLLEKLECFQSTFINVDNLMDLFRHDLAELEDLLAKETTGEDHTLINIQTKLKTLRTVLMNVERELSKLKINFHTYLSENI
jgi:hypothetical protein